MKQQETPTQVAAQPHVQTTGSNENAGDRHHDPRRWAEYPVNPAFSSDLLWEELRGWHR